jgi:hypothetical protein
MSDARFPLAGKEEEDGERAAEAVERRSRQVRDASHRP